MRYGFVWFKKNAISYHEWQYKIIDLIVQETLAKRLVQIKLYKVE